MRIWKKSIVEFINTLYQSLLDKILSHGEPKHEHDWRLIGYGGAGWFVIRCAICEKVEIE